MPPSGMKVATCGLWGEEKRGDGFEASQVVSSMNVARIWFRKIGVSCGDRQMDHEEAFLLPLPQPNPLSRDLAERVRDPEKRPRLGHRVE